MSHRDGAAGTRVNGRRDTTPFLSPSDSQLETRRQREQREARGRCLMTEDAVPGARVRGKEESKHHEKRDGKRREAAAESVDLSLPHSRAGVLATRGEGRGFRKA